jgi:hypothetical protein
MPPLDPPASQIPEIAFRSTIVLVTLAAMAYGVSVLNLSDLTFTPVVLIAGIAIVWLLAWKKFGGRIRPPVQAAVRVAATPLARS